MCSSLPPSHAQTAVNPRCPQRLPFIYIPESTCLELVADDLPSASGLTIDTDGAIYVAVPTTRQIIRFAVENDERLGEAQIFADNLPEPPVGIVYDQQTASFYVSGDRMIIRLTDSDQDDKADPYIAVVDDLPGGAGGWLGNLRISPDRRLYVAKQIRCLNALQTTCTEDDPRRGSLLSFALDGTDPRVEAIGLRDSFDLTWTPDGSIWMVDHYQDRSAELNRIAPDNSRPVDFAQVDPAFRFDPASHPTGIVYHTGGTLDPYAPGLFIAFAGSENHTSLTGYELFTIPFSAGKAGDPTRLIPETGRSTSDASLVQTSFYPYHLYGLAIDGRGWLYLTQQEGRLLRLRAVVEIQATTQAPDRP